ncbi:MAG: UPF0182 family protein [Actinobacteria bacterium]|nr:UPF0182 family protein [Actinomycetota bacterium]NBY15249.1 UPF0182 family protein [Actinomycetota bacterium]
MSNPSAPNVRRSPLAVLISVLIFSFILLSIVASFWADWQWYVSVDHSAVFLTQLKIRFFLFVVAAILTSVVLGASLRLAYRSRPILIPVTPEEIAIEQYRGGLEPLRKVLFNLAPLGLGLLVGISSASQWRTLLVWRNSSPFGKKDPQFGKDISFFMFDLPFWRFFLGILFTVTVFAAIANVIVHYIYGGFNPRNIGRVNKATRQQVVFFLGMIALLKGFAYHLDKFALATKSDTLITGLKYTDVHAVLPAKSILTYIAFATAILFFISLFRTGWTVPFIALGTMFGASLLIGGLYPAFVQQVQVKPSELARETPYIQRNLESTVSAYGLGKAQIKEYKAIDNASRASIGKDASTLANVRLLDPSIVSPTFRNLQQIRGFYAFPDSLDIDRYSIDGVKRGAVLAVREVNLDGVAENQRNWFNDHMVFTHGYGLVGAFENKVGSEGAPSFLESDIPPQGALDIKQPRVYFGEQSPAYSIVGAPKGADPKELDYPDDRSANGQKNNTYDGTGGVPVGNLFQRLVFALHYQDVNILLSNQISSESKLLYDRDPATRVRKVAPWLTLDTDPYPAVVDGRIQWIVDGYTTSNSYPYSARVSLRDATADSVNAQTNSFNSQDITYIRNSVKATVDAYDGTVKIYAWDNTDPLLKVWTSAFPGVVQSKSQIPAGVLEHVRYPEDMFKVQRDILAKYHVKDPQAFYSGQDFWNLPDDPTKPSINQAQPPYYLTLKMPDQKQATFSLTTTFAPNKRQTLAAFMAVNSEPGPDYGTIRVLQLPRNTTIPGPTQVQNNFESDPDVSAKLSLLRQGGSDVVLGNLLSLPVGGGLLYFEPVYVRASQGDGYPLLRKVLVSFGSKVAFEDDLATALAKVFSGQTTTDPGTKPTGSVTAQLADAISRANAAYEQGQKALAKGDFAAYGAAQKRLETALATITELGKKVSK